MNSIRNFFKIKNKGVMRMFVVFSACFFAYDIFYMITMIVEQRRIDSKSMISRGVDVDLLPTFWGTFSSMWDISLIIFAIMLLAIPLCYLVITIIQWVHEGFKRK